MVFVLCSISEVAAKIHELIITRCAEKGLPSFSRCFGLVLSVLSKLIMTVNRVYSNEKFHKSYLKWH